MRLIRWALIGACVAGGLAGAVEGSRPGTGPATTSAMPGTTRSAATRAAATRSKFSQRQEAGLEMARIKTAIDAFFLDTGRFPTTAEGLGALKVAPEDVKGRWKGPYVQEEMMTDPWGGRYQYRFPGRIHPSLFELFSTGADQREGTRDDVRAP